MDRMLVKIAPVQYGSPVKKEPLAGSCGAGALQPSHIFLSVGGWSGAPPYLHNMEKTDEKRIFRQLWIGGVTDREYLRRLASDSGIDWHRFCV
jgi:hypothetical protein